MNVAMKRRRVKRSMKRRYGDPPDVHLDYAGNLTRSAEAYLASAEQAFSADDCVRAFKEGSRAQSAARSALDHAEAAGALGKPPASRASANAYRVLKDSDDFMLGTFMRRCVRKSREK